MSKCEEKQLDALLNEKLESSSLFLTWFLSKTKFNNQRYYYYWSRADHPWGTIPITYFYDGSGSKVTENRQSETDVLLVVESDSGRRAALHIENKLANGHFTELQPEMYHQRAAHWLLNEKYKNYSDFQTVLIAPLQFYDRNRKHAKLFDVYISHEEISQYIPEFGNHDIRT